MQILQLCRCGNDIISGNWVFKRADLRKRNLETRMKEKENWESKRSATYESSQQVKAFNSKLILSYF